MFRFSPRWPWRFVGTLLLLACLALRLPAPNSVTPPVDSVNVDLDTLIDGAAHELNRFAVNIPHSISSSTQGRWTRTGATSTWTYDVRVPTAISLSFHASPLFLPPSAVLTVSAGSTNATYRAQDVNRGGLWSRPLIGDTLEIVLAVNSTEAARAQLQIESLQAGYRNLGGGVADHPHYRHILATQADASAGTSCTQNYSCNATVANQGPAQATVGLLVANEFQCTGTLLNNTRGDGTPYVLTARHCQTGKLGGGAPNAAASVVVYWDAISPCGQTLQSMYYGSTAQSGAVTVVEQQDAWLIKLDAPPIATDAFYAGWDARGSAFSGGYSIHHALAYDKQYVSWYGQAVLQHISASSLQVGYNSTFWGVNNQIGNVGSGSSGGALFDPNNDVVGSGSLANLQNGSGTPGACPVTPPVAPSSSNVAAQYTALSSVWTSTADTTSTTGDVTLQAVLDPDNTGRMSVTGFGLTPITVTVDDTGPALGDTVTLSWNVDGAQSCIASGGTPGDGWAGARAATGALPITNFTPGYTTYSLSCNIGALQGHGSVSVYWNFIAATSGLVGPSVPVMVGGTVPVSWSANVTPCVATGGVDGDGWAGSKAAYGIQNIPATRIGTLTYTLSCGSGARAAATTITVFVVAAYVALSATATQIRVGQNVTLQWSGGGASGGQCVPGGGAPGDLWTSGSMALGVTGNVVLNEATAGTYTYTLTCGGGGQSASSSVTIAFVPDTPAISLTAVTPQQQVYGAALPPGSGAPDLLWSSNVSGCYLSATGPTGPRTVALEGQYPAGSAADVVYVPGHYTYTLQCGNLSAATTIDWVATQVPGVLTVADTRWIANSPYSLSWSSDSAPCTAGGGAVGDGWAGTKSASGTQSLSESAQGTYLFTLTCGSGASASQSQIAVIVAAPSVVITASPNYIPLGNPTTLSWTSTLAPCTYLDGSQGTAVAPIAAAPNGSVTTTPANSGTDLYTVTCGSGAQTMHGTTQVNVQPVTVLSANQASAPVNTPITLTWSAPGSVVCIPTNTSDDPSWRGALGNSGSVTVTSSTAGTVTYQVDCN
ncbi:MAG TPA: hypothetical protein VGC34_11995, partial [Steroidobacteraceae bacterium]